MLVQYGHAYSVEGHGHEVSLRETLLDQYDPWGLIPWELDE